MPIDMENQTNFSNVFKLAGKGALVAALVVLPACGSSSETVSEPAETEATAENVTSEDIAENLESYIGETVTVREEVTEVVGEYAFLMEEEELFGGEEILVINASGEGVELVDGEDTDIQVTGEVREFVIADVEREFDLDLDPDFYAEYEQQPAIIGQSIALAPDPNDITEEPELYYYERIALNGEIEEVLDTNIITIDEESLFGGEDILVLNPNAEMSYTEGEEVTMTGILRPLNYAEIEGEYDLEWDLDLQREIEAEYNERPLFVADEVYPSAM